MVWLLPLLIRFVANMLDGPVASLRRECATAVYGWAGIASLVVSFIASPIAYLFDLPTLQDFSSSLSDIGILFLAIAMLRDWYRLLKPLIDKYFDDKDDDPK